MESQFSKEFQTQVYEVLSSNDNKPMEAIFFNCYSPQESQRSEARRFLECGKKHHPDVLFIKLFFLLRCSAHVETRANAARVLRFVGVSELWPKLREMAKESLKAHFIAYLPEENSMSVLRMVCVIVSETVSEVYKGGKQWPELIDFLLNSLITKDNKYQETSLLILAHLPKACRSLICEALSHNIQSLYSFLWSALASANPDVQIASFGAVVSLVHLFSHPSNLRFFHDLLRQMMLGTFNFIKGGFQGNYIQRAFKEFTILLSEVPQLLKPYVGDIVLDMLQIAEAPLLNDEIHCLSINLVITMTELKDFKPALLNLPHQTLRRLILIAINLLLHIKEDDMERNEFEGERDPYSYNGKINVYKFGIKFLYQLSISLEGSKIIPIAFELLSLYLDSEQWKKRHAGMIMLTTMAKELSDEMILMGNFLGEVVTKILKSFQDSHLQVRLATFKFMEMPTNFIQVTHILYHHRLVTAFVTALDDQNEKVKEQAASAMLFFLKSTLPESLTMHTNMDAVMMKFLALLQENATAKQRSIALSIFNIVAQRCREVAIKHYLNFLPILLEACNDKNFEVKEEAVRGIRICAEFGTPEFKPFIYRTLSELSLLIKGSGRSLPENTKAYEIAVSAIGRICEFHRDSIDASKLVPAWLSHLPLKDDLIEARIMHEQLCFMVARLDKDLLGPGSQNLFKIVAVFVEVVEKGDKLATARTGKQISDLLRQIWQQFPRNTLDVIFLSLNAQQQELLSSVMSS
ncbi:hypothetical protein L6164_030846 [Bauhinia variegata]|uniref:Uncharacterized protein n=1 Tax=Bauhinia variegata TaxID=167791 RepID=A0ACB9LD64_BAUVA|nr:hypothetical protein L6164_030846 [Bauhinia variegata]